MKHTLVTETQALKQRVHTFFDSSHSLIGIVGGDLPDLSGAGGAAVGEESDHFHVRRPGRGEVRNTPE